MTKKTYTLSHPEHTDTTCTAEWCRYWLKNGRNIGLVLQFPGEHHVRHLTFAEIRDLQNQALENDDNE